MKFALVDDEPLILQEIPKLIKQNLSEYNLEIECFQSSQKFLDSYVQYKYHALFLDIDMPEINGFNLTKSVRYIDNNVPIVYITARDDLITQAFRYKVSGFVRKKYIEDELLFALSTIIQEIKKENNIIQIKETRKSGGEKVNIYIEQILYIESIRNNLYIHLNNNQQIITRQTLSFYTEHDGFEKFTAITSGIIVNLDNVELVNNIIYFPNGEKLYISRRKIHCVQEAYIRNRRRLLI